jgi:hypothetical protein
MNVDERLTQHLERLKLDDLVSISMTVDPFSPMASNREMLKDDICDFLEIIQDPANCTPIDWELLEK